MCCSFVLIFKEKNVLKTTMTEANCGLGVLFLFVVFNQNCILPDLVLV